MKFKVTGNSLVVTSAIKAEDIKLAQKFRPDSLTLRDADGEPYFAIALTNADAGSANNYGVCFDGVSRDGNGFATVTLKFAGSNDPDKIKEEVADKYGIAFARLGEIEAALPDVIEGIAAQKAAIIENIEVE